MSGYVVWHKLPGMIEYLQQAQQLIQQRPAWVDGVASIGGVLALLVLTVKFGFWFMQAVGRSRDWWALRSKKSALRRAGARIRRNDMYAELLANPSMACAYVGGQASLLIFVGGAMTFNAVIAFVSLYNTGKSDIVLPALSSTLYFIFLFVYFFVTDRFKALLNQREFEADTWRIVPKLLTRAGLSPSEIEDWLRERGYDSAKSGAGGS